MLQEKNPPPPAKIQHLCRLVALACLSTRSVVGKPPNLTYLTAIPPESQMASSARFRAFFKAAQRSGALPKWLPHDMAAETYAAISARADHLTTTSSNACSITIVLDRIYLAFAGMVIGEPALMTLNFYTNCLASGISYHGGRMATPVDFLRSDYMVAQPPAKD